VEPKRGILYVARRIQKKPMQLAMSPAVDALVRPAIFFCLIALNMPKIDNIGAKTIEKCIKFQKTVPDNSKLKT
jgi:hypothetical protein